MNNISKYSISLNRKQYVFTLLVLGSYGLVSLIAGLNNAWMNLIDFQQPAACLFIAGENPFSYYLKGGFEGKWPPPNYLHHLYVILSSLCILNDAPARLVWALISTVLAVWCSFILCRMAKRPEYFTLICLFFLASLPFRNGIGNDQNQMLILALFVLSMQVYKSAMIGFFGAMVFIKYSFAGSWIGMTLVRDISAVVWSILFAILFVIGGALWISSGDLFVDLFGPFIIASKTVAPGHGDLLTVIDYMLGKDHEYRLVIASLLLMLNIAIVSWLVQKSKDRLYMLAIAGVSALMFLTHLGYDGVFLLPALIFLLAKGGGASLIGLATIVYSWQIVKVLDIFGVRSSSWEWTLVQIFVYLMLLISLVTARQHDGKPLLNLLRAKES